MLSHLKRLAFISNLTVDHARSCTGDGTVLSPVKDGVDAALALAPRQVPTARGTAGPASNCDGTTRLNYWQKNAGLTRVAVGARKRA